MKVLFRRRNSAALLVLALIAAPTLLPGCPAVLCTKRLYLYRDTEQKSLPPHDMALLITDPAIITGVLPEVALQVRMGVPWAGEQPAHEANAYQVSVDALDGRPVYQGLCLDTTPTYVCEVQPGPRRVLARMDLFGPWGHQRSRENASLTLEPGGVYFLHPDWQELSKEHFRLQAERLPVSYRAELRARLMNWLRRHTKGRSLDN